MKNDETQPTRGAGSIIASTLGLLALLAIFLMVGMVPSSKIPLQTVLGELVEVPGANPGLAPLSVERLTDGRMVALFGNAQDLPPEKEMGEGKGGGMGWGMGGGMFGMGGGEPDPESPWPKLPEGETGHAPWQAALVHFPSTGGAEANLAKEFGRLDFKDLSTLPKSGGSAVVDSGFVVWNEYRLPYVRTRHFRMEGQQPVFHESMRINLTLGRHALVLYLRWRPGQKAEVETARPLLDSWAPPVAKPEV